MEFLVLLAILCVVALLFIRRNRERAVNPSLRREIEAQVRFETVPRRVFELRPYGLWGTRSMWNQVRGPKRLIVGTDAFIVSVPQALEEWALNGRESSIALTQMRFGPAGRDWIVITGQAGSRQVQLAVLPDNLPDAWNALAGTGAALVP
jgi:hypothetical protein